ncbi:hypothetical protein SAMN02745885_00581 [Carboxydocella sporoproducens DSM 16521]|uniref:DUF7680 domain-containing protein n=2 Tax=Carboxydocella TaxID=178898 RepID=A0A1T4MI09_9FIRM|nr:MULTISPECIES: hypothetical protein [Carboxydocella]AVX21336.1 hypothetical protein CFE_2173 [Carboxydocella thermautotrophica]SJZ66553.1 hypothetical protein SAMN02745885_00581 [Carboxydocella sporoproducens DSM 16521]
MNKKKSALWDLERDLQQRILPLNAIAPWVLRVTEHKDKTGPVLIIKERLISENGKAEKGNLKDRGLLYGQALHRCLPVIRQIISPVCDTEGIPLELQRFFPATKITYRGNLPLNEEAGAKLALIFKLQERVREMDRVELIAWRVAKFSREEAAYWLSRATQYGETANRWAQAGMRIMLGGQPGDKGIEEMLIQLRKQ